MRAGLAFKQHHLRFQQLVTYEAAGCDPVSEEVPFESQAQTSQKYAVVQITRLQSARNENPSLVIKSVSQFDVVICSTISQTQATVFGDRATRVKVPFDGDLDRGWGWPQLG